MADAINTSSSFVGTVIEELFELLVLGSESIDKGLIHIFPDKRKKVFLDRFKADANPLVARVATPTSAGNWDKTEKSITMGEIMFYREFDPLDFGINNFQYLWSQGSTVRAEAAAELMRALLSTSQKRINENIDKLVWQGDTGSGSPHLALTDGYIKLMTADAAVIDTTPAVVSAANVISILEALVAACPAAVQESVTPTIITDHATKYFYREAARGLDFKGSNIDGRIQDSFGGFPVVSVGGMPVSTLVMTETGGTASNLKAATWMTSDMSNIIVERLQANSDLFFTKSSFDLGFNHINGEEVVLHKAS